MFGKNKYVYSCPDVIHDQQVAKKNALIELSIWGLLFGGWWLVARRAEKKLDAEIEADLADLQNAE